MKVVIISICSLLALQCGANEQGKIIQARQSAETPTNVSHSVFDQLLKKYVDEAGMVNYKGFVEESEKLNSYLGMLSKNPPQESWSENEVLAYWINAYNGFTIQLIIKNYPVKSIKDLGGSIYQINTTWDIDFIKIGDEELNLNNIEHQKIRKEFDEPRIHFALVCAAMSCPRLRPEAFVTERLDAQLTDEAKIFFANSSKNRVGAEKSELSKLMKWYSGDFTKELKVWEYINQYSKAQMTEDTGIDYLDYSWELNEQ